MYAETFNVQSTFEEPAKWLRWAMQSTGARKLDDAGYNLNQFWTALSQAKARAGTARDWGDILLLDSQSQWALGVLYQAQTTGELEKANQFDLARQIGLLNPITLPAAIASLIRGSNDPVVAQIRGTLTDLGKRAEAAFAASKSMAQEAQGYYQRASVSNPQATNTVRIASTYQSGAANDAAGTQRSLDSITRAPALPNLSNLVTLPILGITAWAWAAGVGLVAILVLTGPTIVEAQALRRATR